MLSLSTVAHLYAVNTWVCKKCSKNSTRSLPCPLLYIIYTKHFVVLTFDVSPGFTRKPLTHITRTYIISLKGETHLARIGVATLRNGHGEVFHKISQHTKLAREDKIIQGPQLLKIILDGRAGENKTMNSSTKIIIRINMVTRVYARQHCLFDYLSELESLYSSQQCNRVNKVYAWHPLSFPAYIEHFYYYQGTVKSNDHFQSKPGIVQTPHCKSI